jgi:hypothetical protein
MAKKRYMIASLRQVATKHSSTKKMLVVNKKLNGAWKRRIINQSNLKKMQQCGG